MHGPTDGTFVYQSIIMSNGGRVRDGNRLTFAEPAAAEAVLGTGDALAVLRGAQTRAQALMPANP